MAHDFSFSRGDFPEDFLFGVATAAYQIEGSSFGGCGPSHWDTFAATPGNISDGTNGSIACDHINRYEEDLDLVSRGGYDAYRFSTSWARVLPEGRGQVNQQGLDFYDRLVDGLLARNIKPSLTLYHWDMPAALADLGGWRNRDVASWFADYADIVLGRIGDRVHQVATINEPWCVAFLSHFLGHHAPGLRDIRATARAMHHVLLAHARGMDVIRARGQKNGGIVLNFEYAQAAKGDPANEPGARIFDSLFNRWYAEAIFKGAYPEDTLNALLPHMPDGFEKDMEAISQPIDWLGVNYYATSRYIYMPAMPWPHVLPSPGDLPKTDMGWEIFPDGLHHFLVRMGKELAPGIPVYITENGMANKDKVEGGRVEDEARIDYLDMHFAAARRAIADGVNLKGYYVWSLMDNYEWAFGYAKRFGMVHVDYETQTRTPKASYNALRAVISKNR